MIPRDFLNLSAGKNQSFINHPLLEAEKHRKGLSFLWVVCEEETTMEGGRGRGGFSRGPREMHKATCADCGAECEVPFKPAEGRPVYCRDCYRNKKGF